MRELDWLAVVRHGESVGNVAATAAEGSGLELIDIADRDADVALSPTGRDQADALGRWFTGLPPGRRPQVVIVSPYLRARQTAERAFAGLDLDLTQDERLRDRELGVVDLHTSRGIAARMPSEAHRRERLGKFYYRPPGGEAWTDVLLRLRSLLRDVRSDHPGRRVVLVAHDVVVLLVRYLIDGLDEEQLMAVARQSAVANGSITSWRNDGGRLCPELVNAVDHLHREGTRPTREEGVRAEPV
jgi:probable phosphoglycerate mutase